MLEKDDETIIAEKLNKFEEKMKKASERYQKILTDRSKIGEKRSNTVDKIRSEIKKKNDDYYDSLFYTLIEINENINRSKSKKQEFLEQKTLKKNRSSFNKINRSNDDLNSVSNIEKILSSREERIEKNLEVLKHKYDLNSLIKKEKNKLTLKDHCEKIEFQKKLKSIEKSRIISKHLQTSKAIELKKNYFNKYEQEIREKEYHFSQKFAKNKTMIQKKLEDYESKKSFVTEIKE